MVKPCVTEKTRWQTFAIHGPNFAGYHDRVHNSLGSMSEM